MIKPTKLIPTTVVTVGCISLDFFAPHVHIQELHSEGFQYALHVLAIHQVKVQELLLKAWNFRVLFRFECHKAWQKDDTVSDTIFSDAHDMRRNIRATSNNKSAFAPGPIIGEQTSASRELLFKESWSL